jgi:hypothetical protein
MIRSVVMEDFLWSLPYCFEEWAQRHLDGENIWSDQRKRASRSVCAGPLRLVMLHEEW